MRFYEKTQIPYDPSNKFVETIELVWKMDVPFKIKTFG